jgi:hypothetical protein
MSSRTSILFAVGLALSTGACGRTVGVLPAQGGSGGGPGSGGSGGDDKAGGTSATDAGGGDATPTSIYCFPDRCQPPQQQCCFVSTATTLDAMCLPAEAACPSSYFERCADTSACPGGVCCHGLGASQLETYCTSRAACQAMGRVACTSNADCVGLGANVFCCGGPIHGGSCTTGSCIP